MALPVGQIRAWQAMTVKKNRSPKGKAPTNAMTLKWLKDAGYAPWKVELWIEKAGIMLDLYNFLDYVAIKADEPGVLGIQTTVYSEIKSHIDKIRENKYAPIWLAAGNRIHVHGWIRPRRPGGKWELDAREITL